VLIPYFSQDIVDDYPKFLKIETNQLEIFKSQLTILLSLLDLRVKLCFNEELDLIKFRFPLYSGNPDDINLNVDEEYNLYSLDLKVTACKMKNNINTELHTYFFGFYQNYIVFFKPNDGIDNLTGNYDGFAILKYKYYIKEAECFVNEKDSRFLIVLIKNEVSFIHNNNY